MAETAVHDQIVALAQDAGFSRAGIAPVPQPGEPGPTDFETYFEDWIDRGYAGEMEYLKRRDQNNRLLRSSLRIAVPWARSVIVCAANYNADAPRSLDPASPGERLDSPLCLDWLSGRVFPGPVTAERLP